MTDFRKRLGLALKHQRQLRKLTQPQLAELADLSVRHVADIEGGKKNCTMETLSSLAAALDWNPLVNLTVDDKPRAAELAFATTLQRELEAMLERLKGWYAELANRDVSMRALARKLPDFKREQDAAVERLQAWHSQLVSRSASAQGPAPAERKAGKRARPAKIR